MNGTILILSDFVPSFQLEYDSSFWNIIGQADYVLFNLEGSLKSSVKSKRHVIMSFELSELDWFITKVGCSKIIVALANNHILDSGLSNYSELIEYLDCNEIKYVGTKRRPYLTINNEFSILNFVTGETSASYCSSNHLNYLFYDTSLINDQIDLLTEISECNILYPHWGRDMDIKCYNTYSLDIDWKKWALYGHHPHVISFDTKDRVYSLGNTYIPHPDYYDKYESSKYGLVILYSYKEKIEKRRYLTKITSLQNKKQLSLTTFDALPDVVLRHKGSTGGLKKVVLNLLEFKGGRSDYIRLVAVQLLRIPFQMIVYFRNIRKTFS